MWLAASAAILAIGVAAAHSYLGERYLLTRLFRRAELPKLLGSDTFTRQTLRFAWHITSVAWIGMGAALLWDPPRAIAIAFGITALVAGSATRGKHLSWIAFSAIAVLSWMSGG